MSTFCFMFNSFHIPFDMMTFLLILTYIIHDNEAIFSAPQSMYSISQTICVKVLVKVMHLWYLRIQ